MAQVLPFSSQSKPNHWLSNFDPCTIKFSNMDFSSVEQGYQWAKVFIMSPTEELRNQYMQNMMELDLGRDCKALSIRFFKEGVCCEHKVRNHWRKIRVAVLSNFVHAKFTQNLALKQRLLNTGNSLLAEATVDKFWGAGTNSWREVFQSAPNFTGENKMGEIAMALHTKLRVGSGTTDSLVVGDSLVSGLTPNNNYTVIPWPGASVNDVVRLASILVLNGVETLVLLVGTNDLQA